MNSTAVYDLIKARRDYLMAHKPEAKDEQYARFVRPVSGACLEHCKKVKGICDTQEKDDFAIFSNIPLFWTWESDKIDRTIGSCIRSIWSTENEWCCDLDFNDASEDWVYVTSIYGELLDMLEYTGRTYGEFEIPELDEPC